MLHSISLFSFERFDTYTHRITSALAVSFVDGNENEKPINFQLK